MTISVVQLPLPSRLRRSGIRPATPSRPAGSRSGEPSGPRLRAGQRWSDLEVEGSRVGTPAVPVVQLTTFTGGRSVSALPSRPEAVEQPPDRADVLDMLFGGATAAPFDGPEAV